MRSQSHRRVYTGQRGYALIGVIVACTLLLIALAAVAPRIGTQIKRDREEELVHRGNAYVRAIQLYYRKFQRFPANIEQLENTNNLRFLRKRFPDPVTGKEEWRLIHFGQAKPKQLPAWQKGKGGGSITPAAGLAGSNTKAATPGNLTPGGGLADNSSKAATPGSQGSGIVNAADISKPLGDGSSIASGPIVGVSSTSEKKGLKEINGKTKYNEWEFVYDPTLDPYLRGGIAGGGNAANPNQQNNQNNPAGPVQLQPGGTPAQGAPTPMTQPGPTSPK
jgi:type II secretory pathway pseudopilin PulG